MKHAIWLLAGLAVAAHSIAPVEKYGPLSVDKSKAKVVDSTGAPVTLRGMSLFWHYHNGGKAFWNAEVIKNVMVDWHCTVFRAPIGVDDFTTKDGAHSVKGALSDSALAYEYIRRVANAAINVGAYVIIDWHAEGWKGGDQGFVNATKTFLGRLAKEYGNTPNIIWEIYNEPGAGTSWGSIAPYAKSIIEEIRKYSKNIILVGNGDWDQHPDAAGTELDSYENIAYTVHFYNDHTHWGTITGAMGKKHAVFASEWGMSDHTGGGTFVPVTSGNIASWITNMESNGVSYVNWSLGNPLANEGSGPGAEASAALNDKNASTGAVVPTTGKWDDGDLTPSGKSIRGHLISKNPVWTLKDTTTRMAVPLAITSAKKTDFILKQDTIEIKAAFNKSLSWTLTEQSAQTSSVVKQTTGKGANVYVKHLVGEKDGVMGSWKLGETVNVKLMPLGTTLSYTLSTQTGAVVLRRVHEVAISWVGTRVVIPTDLIRTGSPIKVMLRDASGKAVYQTSAIMGEFGQIELSMPRPEVRGIQILDILSDDDSYVRARLSPKF